MARAALNVTVTSGTPYTVPTGKLFVGQVINGSGLATVVSVNGSGVWPLQAGAGQAIKPVLADAGDVITSPSATVSLVGALYDV